MQLDHDGVPPMPKCLTVSCGDPVLPDLSHLWVPTWVLRAIREVIAARPSNSAYNSGVITSSSPVEWLQPDQWKNGCEERQSKESGSMQPCGREGRCVSTNSKLSDQTEKMNTWMKKTIGLKKRNHIECLSANSKHETWFIARKLWSCIEYLQIVRSCSFHVGGQGYHNFIISL